MRRLIIVAPIVALFAGAAVKFATNRDVGPILLIAPSYFCFGQSGDTLQMALPVVSTTRVRVIGLNAECSCVAPINVPLSIEPHRQEFVLVNVTFPGFTESRTISRTKLKLICEDGSEFETTIHAMSVPGTEGDGVLMGSKSILESP